MVIDLYNFDKNAVFESERLNFRGISANDAKNLVRWRSREDVYQHTPNPRPITLQEHNAWFIKYMENNQSYRAIFTDKETGIDIGMVGGENENGAFVISYYIGEPESRGKGFASEAIRALVKFIQDTTNILTLHAYVQEDNKASIACLTKVGFFQISTSEGTNLYAYEVEK